MNDAAPDDVTSPPPDPAGRSSGSGFPRWLTWGLLGALAVLILGYGAIFLYAKVLNDSPDEFDRDDLDTALEEPASSSDPPTTAAPTSPTSSPSAVADTTTATTRPAAPDPPASTAPPDSAAERQSWAIADGSQVGYRVQEILFGVDTEGVGRTDQITGGLVVEGDRVTDAEFVVDVASIESDDGRRDRQFRGRIMSTDEFPEATFVLTAPIDLGVEPADGVEVATTATGELTLRGVTNPVTFELTAEQQNGRIGVLGSIPVVFAEYGIANPSFGGITTEDEGLLEFVLVFEPG
jgi:polyisoprenoid-binding protein YceI